MSDPITQKVVRTRDEWDTYHLVAIDMGNALSAAIENDLEERGLIVQTDKPYATLTPAGRELIKEA
jgi:predicted methyltransferase